ncbi:MAG: hypothetical protein AAFQ87_24535 [Bacteroidota bacterium]
MKILLAINTVFELLVGLIMLFAPRLLLGESTGSADSWELTLSIGRSFGFAAIAIACLSALMMVRRLTAEVKFVGLGTLTAFHLGLTIAMTLNVLDGLSPIPVVVAHAVLFLVFGGLFLFNRGE